MSLRSYKIIEDGDGMFTANNVYIGYGYINEEVNVLDKANLCWVNFYMYLRVGQLWGFGKPRIIGDSDD